MKLCVVPAIGTRGAPEERVGSVGYSISEQVVASGDFYVWGLLDVIYHKTMRRTTNLEQWWGWFCLFSKYKWLIKCKNNFPIIYLQFTPKYFILVLHFWYFNVKVLSWIGFLFENQHVLFLPNNFNFYEQPSFYIQIILLFFLFK